MTSTSRTVALVVFAALASACSHGDSTAPVKPASIAAGLAAASSGTVGAALATPPTFIVRDAAGNALANVSVAVAVTGGGGTVTGAPSRSLAGPTSVGTWVLGTAAGLNTITVTVSGLSPLTLTATGTPDVPSVMTVVSGNNQSVAAGTPMPQSLSFKVADKFGNGVPNASVTFQVTGGEGFLTGAASATTDLNGIANAPAWTMGKINIPQTIAASSGSLSAAATASISSSYHAEVRFFGPTPDPNFAAAFTRAVNKINATIVGQLSPVAFTNLDLTGVGCGIIGVAPLNETISAMVVYVTIKPIDGVGSILAASGPCLIRSPRGLTVVGSMTFDVADVQQLFNNNQLNDVALHEMQHVVGFGTLWTNVVPSLTVGAGTSQTAFVGGSAISACLQLGGSQAQCLPGVLLENTGGSGTRDAHWRKSVFKTELMTGFISAPGVAMPFSLMTIASHADLGYQVNNSVADTYAVSSSVAASLQALRKAQGLEPDGVYEELLQPRATVSRDGRVTRLR
ncbi:MAG: leishmanolysin-related zinc metalloendopeptidase [Gemmatimonadales bacterium]